MKQEPNPGALLQPPDTLWALLQQRARRTPDAVMLIEHHGKTWTFADVARAAERTAASLCALGIRGGMSVTWQLATGVDAVLVSLALARLGAVQNPVIHLYGRKELGAILAQNRSPFLLAAPERAALALAEQASAALSPRPAVVAVGPHLWRDGAAAAPGLPPADGTPRWVYYTSGTTAEPKGAMHGDASLIAAGLAFGRALGVTAADVGTLAFPYAHVGGAMNIAMLLIFGMSAVLIPKFAADHAAATFARHGVTLGTGSTAHYLAYLAEQRKRPASPLMPALRILAGGGAPKPPELFAEVRREMGCTIAHSYGMTEAPLVTFASPRHTDEQLASSDGLPIPGMTVRIVRPDGTLAGAGEPGEIRIKGPTVCLGYTRPAFTAAAFDEDGFFRTGDIGYLRPDGHLVLSGRLKDVIIRKGENVSAREIEDILYAHPKVGAVAVIGLPDRERGERVCAVVEPKDPANPLTFADMVACFEAAGAMRQKIPEQLEIVDRLPRNDTFNKVLKFKLREMFGTTT
ncbi:class I adenylate-forming enzyme family protein [Massilia putida]|uniref:class I adenylate-forming enzyme family protein n=1 Tax=Massilia putida TaxID=1141883 RepID=UPI000950D68E|nr:class I adenylate-forming enzyme family protein [Massilia putida]